MEQHIIWGLQCKGPLSYCFFSVYSMVIFHITRVHIYSKYTNIIDKINQNTKKKEEENSPAKLEITIF